MKNNFVRRRNPAVDIWRGRTLGQRAAARGIFVSDGATEVLAAEVHLDGASVTQDPADANIAIVELDTGVKSFLNNSGADIGIYATVVTDPTADDAFTTTSTDGVSDREVGITQAAIAAGETGPVRFGGYTPVQLDAAAARGDFLKTSTTPGIATTSVAREEGTFGVLMRGIDPSSITSSDWRVWRESWDGGTIGGTPASWETLAFDDSAWFAPHDLGVQALGGHAITPEEAFSGATLKTLHWLARSPIFTLAALPASPAIEVGHDDGVEIYLNGVLVFSNAAQAVESVSLSPSDFVVGDNRLAVRIVNTATSGVWAVNPTSLILRLHDGDEDLCVIGQPFIEIPVVPTALLFGVPDLIDPAGVGGPLTIKDEGVALATAASSLDFVGPGVTATGSGAAKTITIPGGGAGVGTPGWYNVKDAAYGAVGDGVTDDTTAIAAAITAASATGGIVYFPQGTYKISSTLSLASANVVLLGAGANASSILAAPAMSASDMISISAIRCGVRDLNLYAASAKSGGAGIYLNGASDTTIERVNLQHQKDSIKVNGGSIIRISDCNLTDQGRHGIWVTGVGNDLYLSRIVADNSPTASGNGIYLDSGFQAIIGENCDFLHFTRGLLMSPSATSTWHFFTAMIFDSNSSNGIELGGGAAHLYGVTFVDCWSASNTNQGVYIGTNVEGVNWVGGKVLNNGQHGFDLTGSCTRISITDSLIVSNSQGSSGTYSGIRVDAGVTHLIVKGNHSYTDGLGLGVTQKYGITFDTGATDYLVIDGNDFSSNITGDIGNLAGVSGTHKFIGGSASMTGGSATTYLDGTGAYSTPAGTSPVTGFATPAVVLGTAAAAGAATTVIRSDATIVAFDATAPVTQAVGDSAAAGSAAVAARRDHKHAVTRPALDDLSDVVITSPAAGDRVRYDGSNFVNSALRWEPHVAYDGTVVLNGNGDPVMVEVS